MGRDRRARPEPARSPGAAPPAHSPTSDNAERNNARALCEGGGTHGRGRYPTQDTFTEGDPRSPPGVMSPRSLPRDAAARPGMLRHADPPHPRPAPAGRDGTGRVAAYLSRGRPTRPTGSRRREPPPGATAGSHRRRCAEPGAVCAAGPAGSSPSSDRPGLPRPWPRPPAPPAPPSRPGRCPGSGV